MSALLSIAGLTAHYGDFQALFGVDLSLEEGQTVAIIGANGAGKTTLMRAITGVAKVTAGQVTLAGEEITRRPAPDILTRGIAMVPEGRRLFPSLTVEENLLIGAHARRGNGYWTLELIQTLFPILKERRHNPGTALSGGQQQMVAIGRALMSNPRVLLCDELPEFARKNISKTPLVGGQWRRKEDGSFDLVIVENAGAPDIPLGGTLETLA